MAWQSLTVLLQTGTEISLFKQLVETIRDIGPFGMAILFVVGLQRGWWVMKSEHQALRDRLDAAEERAAKWEQLTMRTLDATERATTVAEQNATVVAETIRTPRKDIRRRPSPRKDER